jgi:hypothetical protein
MMLDTFSVSSVGKLITRIEHLIQEVTTASAEVAQRIAPCGEHHSIMCELVSTVLRLDRLTRELGYRSERFLGTILEQVICHGGDRRSPESNGQPSLAKTGVSRHISSRCRAMAQMSDERWEECMTQVREEGRLIKECDLRPACDCPEPSSDLTSDSPEPTLGRSVANLVAEGKTYHTIFVSGDDLSDSEARHGAADNGRMRGPAEWQDIQRVPFQQLLDLGGRVALKVTAAQLEQAISVLAIAGLTCTEIYGFHSTYDDGGNQWFRLDYVVLIAQPEQGLSPRGRRTPLTHHEATVQDALRRLLEQGGQGGRLDLLGTTKWTDWPTPVPSA